MLFRDYTTQLYKDYIGIVYIYIYYPVLPGWWLQRFLEFSLWKIGEMIQFDEHNF